MKKLIALTGIILIFGCGYIKYPITVTSKTDKNKDGTCTYDFEGSWIIFDHPFTVAPCSLWNVGDVIE